MMAPLGQRATLHCNGILNRYVHTYKKEKEGRTTCVVMHTIFPLFHLSIIFNYGDDNVGMVDHDRVIMGSVVTSFLSSFVSSRHSSGVY